MKKCNVSAATDTQVQNTAPFYDVFTETNIGTVYQDKNTATKQDTFREDCGLERSCWSSRLSRLVFSFGQKGEELTCFLKK